MTDIPIYDNLGNLLNSLTIYDNVQYVDGRVSRGEKIYYKGLGVPYKCHYVVDENINEDYEIIGKSDVFYLGNQVIKKCFFEKYGIFQERYQNHFTDWIGSCGVKELNIFENLYDENKFEKNSIDILNCISIDEENQQYYLEVQYLCGRKTFIDYPNSFKLRELIDYMIQSNWNFPWDKNSISDISWDGRVTDVADIFYSEDLIHKLGSVYSILYSLGNTNKKAFNQFCQVNNLTHDHQMYYVLNSAKILLENGVDISSLIKGDIVETYKNIVKNYLIVGKNCGFCGVGSCLKRKDANQSYGEQIRKFYIDRVSQMI